MVSKKQPRNEWFIYFLPPYHCYTNKINVINLRISSCFQCLFWHYKNQISFYLCFTATTLLHVYYSTKLQTNGCHIGYTNLTCNKYCEVLKIRLNLRINIFTDCSFADAIYFLCINQEYI